MYENSKLPTDDAIHEKNLISLCFMTSEFLTAIVIKPNWNSQVVLPAAMPIGYDLQVKGVTSGDIEVVVRDRSGNLVTDLLPADFEVINEGTTTAPTSATYSAGVYTLDATGDYTYGTVQVVKSTTHASGVKDYSANG